MMAGMPLGKPSKGGLGVPRKTSVWRFARAEASGSAKAAATCGAGKARVTLSSMLHPQFLQFQNYSLTAETVGHPQIVFK